MNKKDIGKITKVAKKLGFNVKTDGKEFLFSQFSPAGQDFNIELSANNIEELAEKFDEYYEAYDISYETYLWLDSEGHGTNGAPHNMRDLYEDMEACEAMIKELSEEISLLVE